VGTGSSVTWRERKGRNLESRAVKQEWELRRTQAHFIHIWAYLPDASWLSNCPPDPSHMSNRARSSAPPISAANAACVADSPSPIYRNGIPNDSESVHVCKENYAQSYSSTNMRTKYTFAAAGVCARVSLRTCAHAKALVSPKSHIPSQLRPLTLHASRRCSIAEPPELGLNKAECKFQANLNMLKNRPQQLEWQCYIN